MPLATHLCEDRLRDVVVPAPVGRTLGERELVEKVTARLSRQPPRFVIDHPRIVDQVTRSTLRLDQRNLLRAVEAGMTAMNGSPKKRAK